MDLENVITREKDPNLEGISRLLPLLAQDKNKVWKTKLVLLDLFVAEYGYTCTWPLVTVIEDPDHPTHVVPSNTKLKSPSYFEEGQE